MDSVKSPGGPPGHWLTGNLAEYRQDPLAFLTRCAQEYGDFVPFRLGPRKIILLSHPDLLEYVLVTNNRNFSKGFALQLIPSLLGNGLVTSEGDFWLRQRRLVQQAFTRGRIAVYGDAMGACAERFVDGWRDGQVLDMHGQMMRLTLEIAAKTFFDMDLSGAADEIAEAMEVSMAVFEDRMTSFFHAPDWAPTPANLRLRAAVRRLDEIVYRCIRQRRSAGGGSDLLSLLVDARDDDGSQMDDRQLRDEALTLLLAGHETTALALSWTWYLLAQHPEVEARLLDEWQSILGGRILGGRVLGGRLPRADDQPRLRFTEMVVQESMRLYPPGYIIGRRAMNDCEVLGHRIPAGADVLMSAWVLHRDKRFYDQPDKFLPDRWAGEAMRGLPKYAYIPFGGGPRVCIGNAFSLLELVVVLAAIGQRYRLSLVPGQEIAPRPSFTLRLKSELKMSVHRRAAAPADPLTSSCSDEPIP